LGLAGQLITYLLAVVLVSLLFMFGGWRMRRDCALAVKTGSPAWIAGPHPGPGSPADVRASVSLALRRLLPVMTSQGVRADVAVPEGILVQLEGTALTGLLERLLATAIDHGGASRLLLTATTVDAQVRISVTDNTEVTNPDLVMRTGDFQDLADQVALLGGGLEIEVRPGCGTTTTLHLPAASDHPNDSPDRRPRQDRTCARAAGHPPDRRGRTVPTCHRFARTCD
jgi:hypothetical protein